jgi:asparaginyl-tRNA synthetase
MLPDYIKTNLLKDDERFSKLKKNSFKIPKYNPKYYYEDLTKYSYFYALITLRHYLKFTTDYYFGIKQKAKNVDLFMLTSSISSPAGPGSDSKPIPLKFGKLDTFLTDSSQFGFEPLLLNNLNKVYCYLPSMRGENFDLRHLNQFFHCEFEMIGDLEKLIPIVENYIKNLCETVLLLKNIINKISDETNITKKVSNNILKLKRFPEITFDEAIDVLIKNKKVKYINFTKQGRDISMEGELELMKILNIKTPLWIKYFDRDRVPFYQKPDPNNKNKTINADLLFPSLTKKSFGGEIIGSGQRQDNSKEIYESLKRQSISSKPYEWYISLRRLSNYKITSGFGLGLERFIAWVLAKDNIRNVIIYPRLKDIRTYP